MIEVEEIIKSILKNGYYVIDGYIGRDVLNTFMPEVYRRFERKSYNGTMGHVEVQGQKYLQHTLAVHKAILDIYLDPLIIDCCERYVSEKVHLQDYRIYQNLESCEMRWHVDNKQTNEDLSSTLLNNKGLIAIVYLEDVSHGPFQIVEGSQLWASKENTENWDDAMIEKHNGTIITFNNKPAGTLILYDFRAIHRAQPFKKGEPRTALFAQYAGADQPSGEPIYLESSALGNISESDMRLLRFGKKASSPTWPIAADTKQSMAKEFTSLKIKEMIKQLAKNILQKS